MLRVGITGGIGSGKSLVCEIFHHLGIPCYNADDNAKRLMETNQQIRQGIISHFGDEAYHPQGLNKTFIGNIVFKNKGALEKINFIVHPVVMNDFISWCSNFQNHPYMIIESAMALHKVVREFLDVIIVVLAPELLRIERVVMRDGLSQEEVTLRIKNQMEEPAMIKLADEVILNDGKTLLLPQVVTINNKILIKAGNGEIW